MRKRSIEINFCSHEEANRIPQRNTDLRDHLRKQYKFLCKSLLEIQKGDSDEVDRVALTLRILFHTNRQSKGLLSQIAPNLKLLDTCPKISLPQNYIKENSKEKLPSIYQAGIVTLSPSTTEMWKLTPSSTPSWVSIQEWWERILFVDSSNIFTPKELVLCIVNTDGGAHIDPTLKNHYYYLSRTGSAGMQFSIDGKQSQFAGPEKIILPHIGFEVVSSLKKSFPEICPEHGLRDPTEKF